MTSNSLNNPLTFPTITSMLAAVLEVVIIISTPIVILFIIFAGFSYVTARGNPEKLQQANTALKYGVIGGVIIVGSVAILAIVANTIRQF